MALHNPIDVSIIIVNYNTKDLVDKCIKTIIENTTDISYEIIVIDNASYDGIKEISSNQKKDIVFIQNEENTGFGSANNKAVERASGTYLFLLNPDTYLINDAINKFFSFMENNSDNNIGVVGCILEDQLGNSIHSYAKFRKPFKEIIKSFKRVLKKSVYMENKSSKRPKTTDNKINGNEIKNVDYITGADIFMRRDIFLKIKGFDQDFFMYFEEAEMQKRLVGHALSRVIINTPKITHYMGASFGEKSSNLKRIMYKVSEVRYISKVHGLAAGKLYKVVCLITQTLNIFIDLYRMEYSLKENLVFLKAIYLDKYSV